jgi:hypothetical protein
MGDLRQRTQFMMMHDENRRAAMIEFKTIIERFAIFWTPLPVN